MTYKCFEDLPVWQASQDLAVEIYALTEHSSFKQPGDLVDQLRRAALSVSNNIAEGFERGSTAELLMYLYIARGSAGEVRSMLCFCLRLSSIIKSTALKSEISDLKSHISNLIDLAESCSRQILRLGHFLQNSNIKGQRHLNDAVRAELSSQQRADAFREKLRKMNSHLPGNSTSPDMKGDT